MYLSRGLTRSLALGAFVLGCLPTLAAAATDRVVFDMVVSAAAAGCLPDATAHVTLQNVGVNQRLDFHVRGLAPDTDYTLFVLQTPTAPFGMSWYQGDFHTGGGGAATQNFLGIFSVETHILAPNSVAAPQPDPGIDAATNPVTAPVHMFHLGIWFADPADAVSAGCPGTVTPFDGDHEAGIQVLNTSNFPVLAGPLGELGE